MKEDTRKHYLKIRSSMSPEELDGKSRMIIDKLTAMPAYQKADWVFTYIEFGSEVRTRPLIERAWEDGKGVAVPKTDKGRLMYFIPIENFDGLTRTKFGTLEPQGREEDSLNPTENTLFVVPGSVFDEEKNRCGYGGGFYDTYIEKQGVKHPVGICYDFQVLEKIETEPFDKKMASIITEKRVL